MTGSLQESYYDAVKEQHESQQLQLSSFTTNPSATTIAITSRPKKLEQYCDEVMEPLGMPEEHLKRYWSYRSGFQTNSAVDNPARRAYDEARLDHHYRQYIKRSEEPQKALSQLVRRLRDGEDLTLVCFEKPTEPCHRHLLIDLIESRLSSKFDFASKSERLACL
jgi:hypothetical protein